MEEVFTCCAGLDIHKASVEVCMRRMESNGRVHRETRHWDTMTRVLNPGEIKNDSGRTVPLTPALIRLLSSRRREDFPFVCWRDENGQPVRVKDFRRAWQAACVECGLGRFEPVVDSNGKPVTEKRCDRCDRPGGAPKPKMRYRGLQLHDERSSAVRNLVEAGVHEKDAMLISGHRTRSTFDRYNIRCSRDVARAGEHLKAYYEKSATNQPQSEMVEEVKKAPVN